MSEGTNKALETLFSNLDVLVTGGAGFIGSHLVDALVARGARVRVLDDFSMGKRENLRDHAARVEVLEGDIRDVDTCRRACQGVSYVFHEAALGSVPRSMADPATSLAVNAQGTANVLAAARDAGVKRVVYASSSSVYGDSDKLPKREGEEGKPLSPYALSKQMDEQLADVFGRCFGLDCVGLRYFNVYGPRQRPDGPYAAVIPRFFDAVSRGEPPTIHGDGTQSRDFTFVGDVVRANLLASVAPRAAGHVVNIGAGGRTEIGELARTICEVCGSEVSPRHAEPRAGDVAHSSADSSAARMLLEFEAEVTLSEGLRRTWSTWTHERRIG